MANNLPPLPPSLGSVSGRLSSASGYTPQGPPIPARNLDLGTPSRPSRPHPGRQAPREFHELGDRAYSAYGEYEVNRMIAYRHLNLPAPPINVPPTLTDENRDRTYMVKLFAPHCEECNERHTVIAHRLYVVFYSQRPFLCLHRQLIVDLEIDEVTIGPPVFLPARIDTVVPVLPGGRGCGQDSPGPEKRLIISQGSNRLLPHYRE